MQPQRFFGDAATALRRGRGEGMGGLCSAGGGGSALRATYRYCPPVSERYISATDSFRLLPLEGLRGERGVRGCSPPPLLALAPPELAGAEPYL